MLWLKLKVGESVLVGAQRVTLLDKDSRKIVVSVDGQSHVVQRTSSKRFDNFLLCAGNCGKGLRLGFEAEQHVRIHRV